MSEVRCLEMLVRALQVGFLLRGGLLLFACALRLISSLANIGLTVVCASDSDVVLLRASLVSRLAIQTLRGSVFRIVRIRGLGLSASIPDIVATVFQQVDKAGLIHL